MNAEIISRAALHIDLWNIVFFFRQVNHVFDPFLKRENVIFLNDSFLTLRACKELQKKVLAASALFSLKMAMTKLNMVIERVSYSIVNVL